MVAAPGDVSHVAGCEATVATTVDALGGLDDIMVTDAAFFESIDGCDKAIWGATLDTNLEDTFFCIKAALPHQWASEGNIVNVASDAGLIGE